jgi:hypothetical protein
MPLKRRLPKIFNIPLTLLILIYLILEELIWDRVAEPIYRYIHGLKLLQRVEGRIHALDRYTLLAVFLSLFAGVEGLGVIALALFAQGLVIPGTLLYAAKIPIAAFTFWLFRIAQDKLLTFGWFKYCYEGLLSILDKIKSSEIYLGIKARIHAVKDWLKSLYIADIFRRLRKLFSAKTG